jgi:hypothetical protein
MNFNVTNIEFDFDDDYADTVCNSDLDTFFIASEVDRKEVTERHLGVWEDIEDEDELIEEITAAAGWCIKSIDYNYSITNKGYYDQSWY